jgi:CheY-like chemotaxis protein
MEAAQKKVVVVAEDEVLIRMLAAEVLIEAGFDVIETEHAAEALAALRQLSGEAHLLFTDIYMPGPMNGLELAHLVLSLWPQIALLITSGVDRRPAAADLPTGSRFIPKPYHPDHVVAHARALTVN